VVTSTDCSEDTQDRPLLAIEGPGDWRATRAPQSRWGRWWERHPVLLRAVALGALGWGTVYLAWRLLDTGRAVNPEAFYALWLVELYNFLSLGLLAFFGWRWSEPVRPLVTPGHSVDVFVATYNESLEVVEATLAGCASLRYPHETYLLDDGRRWEMAALASEWDAHWITRGDKLTRQGRKHQPRSAIHERRPDLLPRRRSRSPSGRP